MRRPTVVLPYILSSSWLCPCTNINLLVLLVLIHHTVSLPLTTAFSFTGSSPHRVLVPLSRSRSRSRSLLRSRLSSLPSSRLSSLSLLPEEIVRNQLDAFQNRDIETAFHYASPENQVLTGPSWQEFEQLMESQANYSPILGHVESTVLMTVANDDWGICCLVRIIPNSNNSNKNKNEAGQRQHQQQSKCLEYWWELTKRQEGDAMEGCWMIDSVQPDFEDMELDLNDIIDDEDDLFYYDNDEEED
jgi:hypothetical protein